MMNAGPADTAAHLLAPLDAPGAPSWRATAAQSVRAAFEGLAAHRLRSALTVVGIVVFVAALLLVVTIGQITRDYVDVQWAHAGANQVQIAVNPPPGTSKADALAHSTLTVEDVQAVASLPHVVAVSPIVNTVSQVVAGANAFQRQVQGGYPAVESLQNLTLSSGTFYTEHDEATAAVVAVIGPRIVRYLFPGVDPVGKELRVGMVTFQVVGVVSLAPAALGDDNDDTIYIPYSTYQQRIARQQPPIVLLQVDQRANVPGVVTTVTEALRQRHRSVPGQQDDFAVWSNSAADSEATQQLDLQRLVLSVVTAIALLVGGFGVGSTMLLAVRQRTREIGVRVAVGARPADILRQFLAEATALSLVGGVSGVLVGCGGVFAFYLAYRDVLMGHWFREAVRAHPVPSPLAILVALGAAILIGVAFGYLPARRAARMDPVQALRQG